MSKGLCMRVAAKAPAQCTAKQPCAFPYQCIGDGPTCVLHCFGRDCPSGMTCREGTCELVK